MLTSTIRRFALLASVAILAMTLIATTSAQQGGSGLIISPTRNELEINPGDTDKITISLRNVSGADITAKAEINDFESDGNTGEPKVITTQNDNNPASIRRFLKNVGDITLKKDEKKDFDINVEVPGDAPAGAYYGIIRYTAIPGGEQEPGEGTIALNASVGTLVLVTVPGNITEQIQVRNIKVQKDKKAGTFFTGIPNNIAVEIKNNGNGFSRPFGRVTVNRGGSEVFAYELNNTEPKANILPGSQRIFTDTIQNVKTPGRYTVVANLSHGRGGEVINYTTSFWYMPLWLLLIIGSIFVAIGLGGYIIYRKKFARKRKKNGRR